MNLHLLPPHQTFQFRHPALLASVGWLGLSRPLPLLRPPQPMQVFFAFLGNPLFPPPQHPKTDIQIPRNRPNPFSFHYPSDRADLELPTETSPPVTCLLHEPFLSETDHFPILLVSQFWGSLQTNAQFLMFNFHRKGNATSTSDEN